MDEYQLRTGKGMGENMREEEEEWQEIVAAFNEHLLGSKHYIKCLPNIFSLTPHNNPIKQVVLSVLWKNK